MFGTRWEALPGACAARRLGSRGHEGLTGRRGRAPGMRVFVESKRSCERGHFGAEKSRGVATTVVCPLFGSND